MMGWRWAIVFSCFLSGCVHPEAEPNVLEKILNLEKTYGGRIGVSAVNTRNGDKVQFRADEAFPLCSTFKTILAAAILKKSEEDEGLLSKRMAYSLADVQKAGHSPVTTKFQNEGMTVSDLAAATIQFSDNAAANVLMKLVDGPKGVTAYARSLGDESFLLERWEPELNTALPNDLRDTTTPRAMEASLKKLVLGDALQPKSRSLLSTWLKGNTTGGQRIRAKLPKNWIVGDKTGTCDYGTTNDIAVIWPEGGSPLVLVLYYTQRAKNAENRDEVLAEAARFVVETLQ